MGLNTHYDLNKRGSQKPTDERYISGLRQGIYVGPERSVERGARVNL